MKLTPKDMTLISLFAALTAIGAYLTIPIQPVEFTLQIVFVMYAGLLLGARRAFLSQLVYVLAGLMGAPIFAGGAGGPGYVFSPTFGYLLGFMAGAWIIGKLSEILKPATFFKTAAVLLAGLAAVYLAGVPYLYWVVTRVLGGEMAFSGALAAGFTPFIFLDLAKVVLTAVTAAAVLPVMRKSGVLA